MKRTKIDKLFKKGLERPSLPFNEEHWAQLEKVLDERKKPGSRRGAGQRLLVGIAAAIALISFALYILTDINPEGASQEIIKKEVEKYVDLDHLQEDSATAKLGRTTPVTTTALRMSSSQSRRKEFLIHERPVRTRSNIIINAGLPMLPPARFTHFSLRSEQTKKDLKVKTIAPKKKSLSPQLAVLLAPDLTSVAGASGSSLSRNFGLMYTQPLTKSFSISAGAIYARKNYTAPFSLYRPGAFGPTADYPQEVTAACDVLDIPLLLNFELLNNKRLRVTLGGGVSSYLMLNERYRFDVGNSGAYGPSNGDYTIAGKNQHWFGVADLSLSIEQRVSETVTVGIRPFVNLPLTGIGEGRVGLRSSGIALTVGVPLKKTNR